MRLNVVERSPLPATKQQNQPKKQYALLLISGLILLAVVAAHLFQLADIPTGLYIDETSIGYNAARIAESGVDEHGIPFPIYFKAFGEYKNPTYIYASALLFKLFGISAFNLRLTSCLFYLIALFLTLLLTHRLFKNKIIQLYTLASLGFLPVFFVLSRISFEAISQLTWVSGTNLLIWETFHAQQPAEHKQTKLKQTKISYLAAVGSGLLLGTSIYTYSTARLLSGLMLISLWVVYFKSAYVKKLILITTAFLLSLLPYALFILNNQGAATGRFRIISYVDDPISLPRKVYIFVRNYFEYWSPNFLVLKGDSNLRHAIGHGGIIFSVTLILFVVAIASLAAHAKKRHHNTTQTNIHTLRPNRFDIFLIVNLLCSPVAASLTSESVPHALRSLLLGYYLLLISAYGLAAILRIESRRLKRGVLVSLCACLALEIAVSQVDYFLIYPSKSVNAMGSFDFQAALQTAIDNQPAEILFINQPADTYANLAFYTYLVDNPQNIPIKAVEEPVFNSANTCVLYPKQAEAFVNALPAAASVEYGRAKPLNWLEQLRNKKPVEAVTKVRCYSKPA